MSSAVAFVLEQPDRNASSYWRALQFVEPMRSRGVRVDVFAPQTLPQSKGGLSSKGARAAFRFNEVARTARSLRRMNGSYDAVFVQRSLGIYAPPALARLVDRFDGRVVLDVDDNVFERAPWASGVATSRQRFNAAQVRRLLTRADHVVAGSAELAAAFPSRCLTTVLPTIPDCRAFPQASYHSSSPLRIVWTGNPGNLVCLDPLREVLAELRDEGVAELTTISAAPWDGPAQHAAWSREAETRLLAASDVGIMPLPDTPYAKSKAGFKLLMYMGVGLPVIASPVGVNRTIVGDASSGVLASTPDEWRSAIVHLTDARERERFGLSGRDYVGVHANVESHTDALLRILLG